MKKILVSTLILCFVLGAISVVSAAPKPKKAPTFPAPTNLSATAVSASQIDLEWDDNSDNETGFKIERSLNGTSFSEIDSVGANVTTYSDTDLDEETTYYYRVRAYQVKGSKTYYSYYSNTDSDITFSAVPDDPTSLSAAAISSSQINLGWSDNSDNEDGFKIERSLNGVDFSEIDSVGADVTTYPSIGLDEETTYYYRVRAYNGALYSDYSNIDSDTTFSAVPDAPTSLSITAVSTSQINLGWSDNSDNETGFKIERSLNGVDFSEIDSVGTDVITYPSTGLDEETTYYYRVRAYNGPVYSGYTNIDSDTTFGTAPDAPSNLDAWNLVASTSLVVIDWQDNSDNEDGFMLERSTNGVDYDDIASTTANIVSCYDFDVVASTTYYYKAKAFNEWGESGYSNVDSVFVTGF